jgi:flagellar biosynthesis GTPase FlhF
VELVTFIAESAADAAQQVRTRLGPSAVVVNVRPLPTAARKWFGRRKATFEILAYRPEESTVGTETNSLNRLDAVSDSPAGPLAGFMEPMGNSLPEVPGLGGQPDGASVAAGPETAGREPLSGGGAWKVGGLLEASGILPANAQRVVDDLRRVHGETPPDAWGAELELARTALMRLWRPVHRIKDEMLRPHVFVGPAGVGKTTCLCKWLTQSVLLDGKAVRAWRLDGATANAAESLSVYCEILGIPLERQWAGMPGGGGGSGVGEGGGELGFIDLPGVDWRQARPLTELRQQLEGFGSPIVHLVLNGAYDLPLLLKQVRAFSGLPIADLVVTHLDEETRWGKLWNLVLGTNYSLRFLSAGQNIPGEFVCASAEAIFLRQFPA